MSQIREIVDKCYTIAQDQGCGEILSYLDKVLPLGEPEELPQYIVFTADEREDFQDKLNWFAEDGYKLARAGTKDYIDMGQYFYAVLYLDVGYKDVVRFAQVKPQDVNLYLDHGWEITSTSTSTKFIRMVLRERNAGRDNTETEGKGASATPSVED